MKKEEAFGTGGPAFEDSGLESGEYRGGENVFLDAADAIDRFRRDP
jgi:hypothetical protein